MASLWMTIMFIMVIILLSIVIGLQRCFYCSLFIIYGTKHNGYLTFHGWGVRSETNFMIMSGIILSIFIGFTSDNYITKK